MTRPNYRARRAVAALVLVLGIAGTGYLIVHPPYAPDNPPTPTQEHAP